jgi:hypothetical protein
MRADERLQALPRSFRHPVSQVGERPGVDQLVPQRASFGRVWNTLGEPRAELGEQCEEVPVLVAELPLERFAGAVPPVEIATTRSPRRTIEPQMKLQCGTSSTALISAPAFCASRHARSLSLRVIPVAKARNAPSRSPGR